MTKIILVGCDVDFIFSLDAATSKLIHGYCSLQKKTEIPFRYLGNLYEMSSEYLADKRLLIICDDINMRRYCYSHFHDYLYTYLSPDAYICSTACVGVGSIVMPFCYVSALVKISSCCKLNLGCQLHHHSSVHDFSVLAPRVTLLGRSTIGRSSYIGSSTTVREECSIGDSSIIGMGSIVVNSIESNVMAYGVPCKTKYSLPSSINPS